jgi:hypothetical protein
MIGRLSGAQAHAGTHVWNTLGPHCNVERILEMVCPIRRYRSPRLLLPKSADVALASPGMGPARGRRVQGKVRPRSRTVAGQFTQRLTSSRVVQPCLLQPFSRLQPSP